MADVLIVCVREDEPQAKALADMFEAAGFTIGGAPSNDAALRSSGAGVIVWSQASIRSRPFLDAAQRVINAGKAVVASLIEPPPASSIGNSSAFDLSHWDGDPNDPALDPLFFAVDRMVNSARTAVAGTAPAPLEPAPPQRVMAPPPQPRATPAPQPRPASYRPGPSDEQLGAEAEHWRSIRESRNPADFMDYLARFGPDGAFADVAELRLKQLTAAAEQRVQARAQPAPAPTPTPRPAPRPAPTMRAPEPPPRRVEPPPARPREAALPPSRGPYVERQYDALEVRDPPRGDGGLLRFIILGGVLSGLALAAGLYFSGLPNLNGASDGADARPETETAADYAPPEADTLTALAPESVPLAEAAPPRTQVAAQREPPAPARTQPPARRTPERAEPRTETRAAPTPSPVASWEGERAGGPVSLSPGSTSSPASTGPSGVIPLSPPSAAPVTTPASSPTPAATAPQQPARAAAVGVVQWTQRPTARRIADLYPQRALREGAGGRVVMDCTVQGDLSLACRVASETPSSMGFGRAALEASSAYRASPTLSNGANAVGAQARIAVSFQAPQ